MLKITISLLEQKAVLLDNDGSVGLVGPSTLLIFMNSEDTASMPIYIYETL